MFKTLILFKQKTIWQEKLNLVRQFDFKNVFKDWIDRKDSLVTAFL